MNVSSLILNPMVKYKTIEFERVEDAPFVGALISACDCKFDCLDCFNQNIKHLPTISDSVDNIIKKIKSNPFNSGIIFGGLEWTLQLNECIELARMAKQNNLQTMIYTGNGFDSDVVRKLARSNVFDYIKCGKFVESLKTTNHIEYGVVLASSNQHIYKKGVDY